MRRNGVPTRRKLNGFGGLLPAGPAAASTPPAVYDPRDEGAAVLWVDFSDAASFTESGGVVTALTNKISGGSLTPTASPTYSATALNSKPGSTLNGSSQYYEGSEAAVVALGVNAPAYTVTGVAIFSSIDVATDVLFSWANSGVATSGSRLYGESSSSTGRMRAQAQSDAGVLVTINGVIQTDTTAHVYSFHTPGVTAEAEIDGVTDIASTALDPGVCTGNRYAIGARPDNIPDAFMNGIFSEIWVHAKELDSAARARVLAYLKAKWNTP